MCIALSVSFMVFKSPIGNNNFMVTVVIVTPMIFKGTGHFFETLSVGSVPGTDHS